MRKKKGRTFLKQLWGGFSYICVYIERYTFLTDCFPNLISPSPSLHSHQNCLFSLSSKHKLQSYTVSRSGVSLLPPPPPPRPVLRPLLKHLAQASALRAHISPLARNGATGGCSPAPLPMGEFKTLFVFMLSQPPNPTSWSSPSKNLISMILHVAC